MRSRTFFSFILLTSLLFGVFYLRAAAYEVPAAAPPVFTLDIGIRPSVYKKLINDEIKVKRPVILAEGENCEAAKIKIRGATTRVIAQASQEKRIPFNISEIDQGALFAFFGNSSVNFANVTTPFSLLADHIALNMFSYMNIPVPAHTFVFVSFNGVDFGLYYAVEDLNKSFFEKNFGEPLGSAYKFANEEKSRTHVTYDSPWFYHLYAKQDRGSARLNALINALDAGAGFEDYLDVDETLRFFACSAVCGGGPMLTEHNNYVLYDNAGKFILIPWDMDAAFTADDPVNGIDHFLLDDFDGVSSPLFTLLMQNESYRERYYAYIDQLCNEFLAPEVLLPYLRSLADTLAPYLLRDHSMYLNGPDTPKNLLNANRFTETPFACTVEQYRLSARSQLAGETDSFYYDETLAQFSDVSDLSLLIERLISFSPLYDAALPQKIAEAYPVWQASVPGGSWIFAYAEHLLAGAVFALGWGAAVVICLIPMARRRRKTRSIENGSDDV